MNIKKSNYFKVRPIFSDETIYEYLTLETLTGDAVELQQVPIKKNDYFLKGKPRKM
jgi:hypothetical protein